MSTIAQEIVSALQAQNACRNKGNREWADRWSERLQQLQDLLPRGSGFDAGTQIVEDQCARIKLVLFTQFHHMDQHGGYTEWTQHTLTVTPDWEGVEIKISGRDVNQIKDYIVDQFQLAG